jgi:polar amino acid transport system permease protein
MERLLYYYFNLPIIWEYLPELLHGFLVTVQMAVLIVGLGIAIGFVLAFARSFHFKPLNLFIVFYVDMMRAIPQLVIIVFVYFALPYANITFSPFWATVISLTAVLSAFAEECFWTGIAAVPEGQMEAAKSTGLTTFQATRRIIMPQAIRLAIPPLTNWTIAITKGTSLGSVVAAQEIINRAAAAQSAAANPSPLMMGAFLYLLLFAPWVRFSRSIEKRFKRW